MDNNRKCFERSGGYVYKKLQRGGTQITKDRSPHGPHDTPHGTEYPHGTQDNPHGTYDIPHNTQDIPNMYHGSPTVLKLQRIVPPHDTEDPHGT